MIIVTGAAGFIGSNLISQLLDLGFEVVGVDDFLKNEKCKNFITKEFKKVDRNVFLNWLNLNSDKVSFIFHLGARTDTAEFNWEILEELNLEYSKKVFKACTLYQIPLLYASSAATYGSGENGYFDRHNIIPQLSPLNPYGISKNEFDKWVLDQAQTPNYWIGLKFFNVYGPNEYHKGRMASVVLHAFNQTLETGSLKLFKSHNVSFKNGEQLRDFIYVKDIVKICMFFMNEKKQEHISGIYNAGTGKARTFFDLGEAVFEALGLKSKINFIDMPLDIRDKYQYFTEANTTKLFSVGFKSDFYDIREGVADYVKNYLLKDKYI
jgi:ADP-L-glycero-D-manno-heptose 6-epimerase